MTPTEALTAIRDLAIAALGGVVVAPPVDPPGAVLGPADADGAVRLSRVESYFAQNPDPVVIQQFPGEPPIAPIVAVRRFHLLDGLSLIADAELRERVNLSASGGDLRQNRAVRYVRAPWYKPGLKWVEDSTISGCLASARPAAWVAQAVIGRHKRMVAQTQGLTHYLWLTDADYAAGA